MVNEFLFWVVAALTVIPASALLFAKKTVHIAMAIVMVMVGLAIAYVMLEAPFLGVVQIVVYTGAVMMLFLFVLMLVGVDKRESLREEMKGRKWIGLLLAGGIVALLASVVSRVTISTQRGRTGDPLAVAGVLFDRWFIVMEALGFVLITAAVGALMLTYVPRLKPRMTQKELHQARLLAGADPVNKPMPGVYARHNALDVPALDPDGKPIEDSISRVLEIRHQTREGTEFVDDIKKVRRELGVDGNEEETR